MRVTQASLDRPERMLGQRLSQLELQAEEVHQGDVFATDFLEQFIHGVERAADNAVTTHFRRVPRRDGNRNRFFVDVQADIMHFFIHGCLVSFIDESGASHASHNADRSAPADNPPIQIKHPLFHFVKPYGLG